LLINLNCQFNKCEWPIFICKCPDIESYLYDPTLIHIFFSKKDYKRIVQRSIKRRPDPEKLHVFLLITVVLVTIIP